MFPSGTGILNYGPASLSVFPPPLSRSEKRAIVLIILEGISERHLSTAGEFHPNVERVTSARGNFRCHLRVSQTATPTATRTKLKTSDPPHAGYKTHPKFSCGLLSIVLFLDKK